MSSIRYTEEHEWVRSEDDGTVTIGITEYAQVQLGDIVFVQLPDVGASISPGEEAVVIESVKAAADIKMPIAGEVVAVNESLVDAPEIVNSDPMGEGWILKVRPENEDHLAGLLNEDAYSRFIGG